MQHISIRVPWRDRAWDGHICDHAVDNASCILLKNIGDKRDDEYESEHAGEDIATLDTQRVPCLSERGTFMSPAGYSLTKTHPYSYAAALKPHLRPSAVNMPGYAFEAVPFRWMARNSFEEEVLPNWEPTYDPEAEDRAVKIVGAKSTAWIMDGHNQSSVIRSFFEPVTPGQSLVFIYLKHSPFQEEASRKVLVGAAHVSEVQLPGMWNQVGEPPFPSSMWETAVVHSLRPDMRAGILLPYQSLIPLLDEGMDVDRAIAWAPEDRGTEFAYVTEHVSDDGAIGALESLRDAATGFSELGIELPQTGMAWVEDQIERLWRDRGPTPGLGSVLKYLGVEAAYPTANHLEMQLPKGVNPWTTLETYLGGAVEWPEQVRHRVPKSVGAIWTSLDGADRDALKLLSALDITADQVEMLFEDNATEDLSREELVANPYYAAICSHQHPLQVSFNTVDRAVFPAPHVTWESPLPAESQMSDPRDRRRVEAFVTDLLEEMAQEGDTLSGLPEIIERANLREFVRPLKLSPELLRAYGLDGADGGLEEAWSPVVATKLADMSPALKLRRLEVTKCVILESLEARRTARRYVPSFDSRSEIDRALPKLAAIAAEEELARLEKAAGLEELYSSRLSVLVGPAGTGKTTLLRALAELPDVADKGILLLAPTGKAAVQLKTKVGQEAHTLASFLIKKNGYDTYTGQYMPVASNQRVSFGTVVIDEASMLTEEMLAATLSALGKVDRLVLVGDPRQLPPIGAGRPFVDLVESLRPERTEAPITGPGYVELTVFRRQDGSDREDLALAGWFGGSEAPAGGDEIWRRLRSGAQMATLQVVPWQDGGIIPTLMETLNVELALSSSPCSDAEYAFQMSYGGSLTEDGKYLNWHTGEGGAGVNCEKWQILTPTRSRIFGTVELNRHIKRTLRTVDLEKSRRWRGWRNPAPIGPELIVRGDKVMQTRNDSHATAWPKGSGTDYVANGDIGVVVGEWSSAGRKLWARVEFASQPGATYSYRPSSSDDQPLELAWAVTVHKSQGSEFGLTILVLPRRARVSRELLYTALTRQTERVVILQEGTIDDLVRLASPALSETARRITDLFRAPKPRVLQVDGTPRRFDDNLIHVATTGVMVRSKNEVIVADILESVAPGRWDYETPFVGLDGTSRLPDFTIETASGETILWEHLGMMSNPRYKSDWAKKKQWYLENGIVPHDDPSAPGARGTLMWTDDRGGVDRPAWEELAKKVIGPARSSRPMKKAAPKKPPK